MWTVLEDPNITITDMNDKYLQLVTFLDDSSKNVQNFMTGQLFTFGEDTYIEKGPIFDALMRQDKFDNIVEMFLQILLSSLCSLSKKLFVDHLPGGKLSELSDEMKEKVRADPKTSCFAESVFGRLDQLLRTKPNSSTLAAEACIMFLNNKTLAWLEHKPQEKRQKSKSY